MYDKINLYKGSSKKRFISSLYFFLLFLTSLPLLYMYNQDSKFLQIRYAVIYNNILKYASSG